MTPYHWLVRGLIGLSCYKQSVTRLGFIDQLRVLRIFMANDYRRLKEWDFGYEGDDYYGFLDCMDQCDAMLGVLREKGA